MSSVIFHSHTQVTANSKSSDGVKRCKSNILFTLQTSDTLFTCISVLKPLNVTYLPPTSCVTFVSVWLLSTSSALC